MKTILPSLRTPLVEFRSALAVIGIRTREEYDELVHAASGCEVRSNLSRVGNGQLIKCFITVEESWLLGSELELFNDLTLDGYPLVGYGVDNGGITFEFEWLHVNGTDWRISAERIDQFMQLLCGHFGPTPRPAGLPSSRRRPHTEFSEGVLARVLVA